MKNGWKVQPCFKCHEKTAIKKCHLGGHFFLEYPLDKSSPFFVVIACIYYYVSSFIGTELCCTWGNALNNCNNSVVVQWDRRSVVDCLVYLKTCQVVTVFFTIFFSKLY